ncbi:hypothetical protein GF325_15505 [Candidatus Bathyarchaeota archaeon]|nr:hypothetical protein [Candidatus Bathyarchaeota archaeon]
MFKLGDEEKSIGKLFKKIASHENKMDSIRMKLASEIDDMITTKSEGMRKLKEVAKMIEDLQRTSGTSSVDKSKLDSKDIETYNKWAGLFEKDIKQLTDLSSSIKTLSYQVETTVNKLEAFGEGFENLGRARNQLTKADKTLFEKKDKLMKPEKIGKMETEKEDAIREFDQAKTDIIRRKDEYLKEAAIFNEKLNEVAEKMKV